MQNFDFFLKTKIFYGNNRIDQIADILSSYGFKRVVILIGQGSVKKSGLLDRIINKLNDGNIEYLLLDNIRPNPVIQFIYDNIDKVRKFSPDALLAVGGGSVIDTGKSLSAAYYYERDAFDFNLHKAKPNKCLPLGVILTISAAGSEMSTSCVMQDDDKMIKAGFNSELNRPLFVIEDPTLTYSVSKVQTAYGVVDILMHTLERYFSASSKYELADSLAEGLIRQVLEAGIVAYNEPNNYDARKSLMLASSFSHNGMTSIGKSYMMPVHMLEHALSGVYPNVAHAAGLAVLWPKWARTVIKDNVDKFDSFSKNVFHSFKEDKYENGLYAIKCLENYFKALNMPMTFKDLGIDNIDIDLLIEKANHKIIDKDVASQIFEACI